MKIKKIKTIKTIKTTTGGIENHDKKIECEHFDMYSVCVLIDDNFDSRNEIDNDDVLSGFLSDLSENVRL